MDHNIVPGHKGHMPTCDGWQWLQHIEQAVVAHEVDSASLLTSANVVGKVDVLAICAGTRHTKTLHAILQMLAQQIARAGDNAAVDAAAGTAHRFSHM